MVNSINREPIMMTFLHLFMSKCAVIHMVYQYLLIENHGKCHTTYFGACACTLSIVNVNDMDWLRPKVNIDKAVMPTRYVLYMYWIDYSKTMHFTCNITSKDSNYTQLYHQILDKSKSLAVKYCTVCIRDTIFIAYTDPNYDGNITILGMPRGNN